MVNINVHFVRNVPHKTPNDFATFKDFVLGHVRRMELSASAWEPTDKDYCFYYLSAESFYDVCHGDDKTYDDLNRCFWDALHTLTNNLDDWKSKTFFPYHHEMDGNQIRILMVREGKESEVYGELYMEEEPEPEGWWVKLKSLFRA